MKGLYGELIKSFSLFEEEHNQNIAKIETFRATHNELIKDYNDAISRIIYLETLLKNNNISYKQEIKE